MKVLLLTAVSLVVVTAIVLGILWTVNFFIRFVHHEKKIFDATVVAIGSHYAITRGKAGDLYVTEAEGLSLGDEVVIEETYKKDGKGRESLRFMPLSKYEVSPDDRRARKAQVVSRLNPEIVICQLQDKLVCVMCDEDEQEKHQEMVSMVVGIKDDGNDRQVLKCKDVAHLPVSFTGETLHLPLCHRI